MNMNDTKICDFMLNKEMAYTENLQSYCRYFALSFFFFLFSTNAYPQKYI